MTPKDPLVLKDDGDKAFKNGDLPLALSCYEEAITLRPQFYGAYYQKGEVLSKMGKSIEAATMYWQAYLFSEFNPTVGLMAARTLAHANFPLEACHIFSLFKPKHIDAESMAYYIHALRQQGLIKEAYLLLPQIKNTHTLLTDWAKAMIFLDLNMIHEARELLEPWEATDTGGHVATLLHAVYLALNDKKAIRSVLDKAIKRVLAPDYFCCQRIALDVLDGLNKTPLETYRTLGRVDLIDAAHYLQQQADKNLRYTGSTYQTFDLLAPLVPQTGLILEFGVRFGYSMSYLATLFPKRALFGFDSFQGLPEDWHHEAAGSYSTNGKIPTLAKNVSLISGWFHETLPDFKKAHPEPISFMNIDCDLYSSTKLIFEQLSNQIVSGTIIVFDEYIGNVHWRDDEFKAFQEWTTANKVHYKYLTASFYTKQVSVQIMSKG